MISNYLAWICLAFLLCCFPNESIEIGLILGLRLKTLFLNAVLFVYSYYFYLKLGWALWPHGLKPPPFKFTPIQDRTDV